MLQCNPNYSYRLCLIRSSFTLQFWNGEDAFLPSHYDSILLSYCHILPDHRVSQGCYIWFMTHPAPVFFRPEFMRSLCGCLLINPAPLHPEKIRSSFPDRNNSWHISQKNNCNCCVLVLQNTWEQKLCHEMMHKIVQDVYVN